MSRTLKIALWVGGFLLLGVFVALSYGVVPQSWKPFLVVVFVVGPLLLIAEPLLQTVCFAVGLPVCFVLKGVPGIGRYFERLEGDGVGIVGMITIAVLAGVGYWLVGAHSGTTSNA